MKMVKFVSKFYIAMNINYLCWNKLKGPGIPAHLSVTRILFEIDVNEGTRGRCLQLRIEEKQNEKKGVQDPNRK